MPPRSQTLEWLGDTVPSDNSRVNSILQSEENQDATGPSSVSASSDISDTAAGNLAASSNAGIEQLTGAFGSSAFAISPDTSSPETTQTTAPNQVGIKIIPFQVSTS